MKLKKILASLTAAAMAVTTMAFAPMSVSAAEPVDFGPSDGNWAQGDFVNESSAEMTGVDVSSVTSVTFNAVAYDLNYGWNNGQFYVDGNNWEQKSFGGTSSSVDITLDNVGAFSVTLDFGVKTEDNNKWGVGWGTSTNSGAFAVYSIDFFAGSEKVGTWTNNVWIGVDVPATSITLDPTSLSLKLGDADLGDADLGDANLGDAANIITASVTPANTTDTVEWSIDDDTVASIEASADGLSCTVIPKAAGTATITAKANADVSATCAVTVEENTYAITVKSNNEAYGTASADKPEAAEGETVKLTATPNTGYKFVEWQSDEVTITNNEFTMPAEEVTVTAVFAEKEADEFDIVVIENNYGGVVVEGGLTAAKAGDEINLIVTPNVGLELDYISVNEKIIEGTSFVMPAEDVTISATFTASTYNIEVEAIGGGTASADKTTAVMGETVNITVKPNDGYDLSYIKVNGTKISGTSFTMPAENVKVVVSFYYLIPECKISKSEDVSVDVKFVSFEEFLQGTFGNDYEALTRNHTLSAELCVAGESVVSAEDKALVEAALAPNQKVGLYLDLSLYKKIDDKIEKVTETIKPISLSIGVPDSIIADGRTYSAIRVHDGKAENIGGTFDRVNSALLLQSHLYSTYAIVYEDAAEPEPEPEPQPEPVKYYSIVTDSNVTASASTASAGTVINVKAAFGYDAYVYCGAQKLAKITGSGSFTMPAGNVRIVSVENGYLSMIRNAAPNSYIFVYDSDMNYIKTNGSVKGIVGEGKVTVKLGEEYAGRTVTLYKGRKSTSVKIASMVLDENGNAAFTVEGGKNYTAVVE